ncbi:hypothetical protein LOTGIDRAFT_229331 [Lottia gigantea]|uniref:Uncharacterized protein n=1 Tax=Lottia gigantea TaxID=225164 RepID=V3Z8G5_LOTGI|nr:hypothetical protein LOTGIDRAFT_229331 [Lottia gigantea]ESO87193.1 hypothetical protein LOTGIDRAFT_229331 [Lottia gigantea]
MGSGSSKKPQCETLPAIKSSPIPTKPQPSTNKQRNMNSLNKPSQIAESALNVESPKTIATQEWKVKNLHELMCNLGIREDNVKWWEVVDNLIATKPMKIVPQTQRKGWKTVRLFISSTFKDMNNEREYLIKTIIPTLRLWCEERKIKLVECDLRWGVPKDSDTRETLMACLSEIDRCREEDEFPYFLCMLSERYGYVCDPLDVPEDIKIRYKWIPGMSVTALEIFTGAYWDRNKHALYMLRDGSFLSQVKDKRILEGYRETLPEKIESLDILKGKLREHYRDQIREYKCELTEEKDGQLILSGFKQFGEDIINHFKEQIEEQYPPTSLGRELTDVEIQKLQQMDFLLQRSQFLLGRDEGMSTMIDYINTDHAQPGILSLVGYPGAGKSSLMAYSAKNTLSNTSYKVFYHFVGATPDSTDPYSILTRFYKECLPNDDNMPADLENMLRYAPTMFQKAAEQAVSEGYSRLVVYFDALNQMEEDGHSCKLDWLPRQLTSNLKMIVSTLAGSILDSLRSHKIKPQEIAVEPLNLDTRRDIVRKVLQEYNKQLDQEQMSLLISKDDAGRPLWLSIACEDLRVYGDFRGLTDKIHQLPGDLLGLTEIILIYRQQVLKRVIQDYGQHLVEATLCLLETSRFGLMESELLELLTLKPITYCTQAVDNSYNGKLLMAQWALVYLGLKPFLRPFGGSGEGRLDFYHRSTSKVVRQVYLDKPEVKKWWHQRLADYFRRCKDCSRSSEELPFHLYHLNNKDELTKCLVTPEIFLCLSEDSTKQQLMKYWIFVGGYDKASKQYSQLLQEQYKQLEAKDKDHAIKLKTRVCWFLVDIGEYDKAEELLKPFIKELESSFGSTTPQLCEPLLALLTLYYRAGLKFVYGSSKGYKTNRQKGSALASVVVNSFEANYPENDPKLGDVYIMVGYFQSTYLDKAKKLFEKNKNNGGLAQVYYMLGERNQYHDDMEVPISYFQKSLQLCLSSFGRIHLNTARSYQLYGQLFWNRWASNHKNEYLQKCLGFYINEVEILEEILGAHHPNVVRSREDVIIILDSQGRKSEAYKYKILQPEHNDSV